MNEHETRAGTAFDAMAPTYDDHYEGRRERIENDLCREYALRNLNLKGDVLDIGCGTGLAYALLGRDMNPLTEYHGIDPSEGMLRAFESKLNSGTNGMGWMGAPAVKLAQAGVNAMPYADERFNAALCLFGGVSYSMDPVGMLKEVRRVLAPGGRAMLMGFAPRWGIEQATVTERRGAVAPRVLYTPELWDEVCAQAGVEVADLWPLSVTLDQPWASAAREKRHARTARGLRRGLYLTCLIEKPKRHWSQGVTG